VTDPQEDPASRTAVRLRQIAAYVDQGLVPIPVVPRGKVPLIEWDRLQDEPPEPGAVEGWFRTYPNANVGLICGPASKGFIVLDIDDKVTYQVLEAIEKWSERTPVARTGGGGYHVWLRSEKFCSTFTIPNPKIEVKGYGSQIVAPPSIHQTGRPYEFINPNIKTIMSVQDAENYAYGLAESAGTKYADEASYEANLPPGLEQGKGDPYPIQRMLQGVKEGLRNNTALILASYYMAHRKLKPDECERVLLEWNSRNSPPLPHSEIKAVVKSVQKHGYRVGFRRIHSMCPSDGCQECRNIPKPTDYQEADRLLRDPSLLWRLNQILAVWVEGEEKSRLLILLLGMSGKLPAEYKAIITIKGESSAGKSNILRILTRAYKVKEVGRFSPTALEYGQIHKYDILLIKELYGEDKSRIRLLSSSDGGYTASVSERDPASGKFHTSDYNIPSITIATSTTRIHLDPQFSNRAWEINVDESPELTERVYGFKEREEDERINQIVTGASSRDDTRFLRAVMERLQPCDVLIPYVESFRDLLDPKELRSRRDWDKIHDLVYYSAFLHQHQRPRVNGAVLATLQDLYYALTIGLETFQRVRKGLEKRIENAIPMILALPGEFTRKELAEKLVKSDSYVKDIVKALKEKAVLHVARQEGRLEYLEVADRQVLSSLSSSSSFETMTIKALQSALSGAQRGVSSNPCLAAGLDPEYLRVTDPVSGRSFILSPSTEGMLDDTPFHAPDASERGATVLPASNDDDVFVTIPSLHTGIGGIGSKATMAPSASAPGEDMAIALRGSPMEVEHDRVVRRLRGIAQAPDLSYFGDYAADMLGDSEKARVLVKGLVDEGQLVQSPDGLWRWTWG